MSHTVVGGTHYRTRWVTRGDVDGGGQGPEGILMVVHNWTRRRTRLRALLSELRNPHDHHGRKLEIQGALTLSITEAKVRWGKSSSGEGIVVEQRKEAIGTDSTHLIGLHNFGLTSFRIFVVG